MPWRAAFAVGALTTLVSGACQCFRAVGSPEECDGLDNDGNGKIDDGPDGGLLSRDCPLQLGVCAGAQATCINGHWAECDYGPDYQLTERKCDGLDNDCDGRIDTSWARVLLDADAGTGKQTGVLLSWDVIEPQLITQPGGFVLTLPDQLLFLSEDLVVTNLVAFPHHSNNESYLFENGADWMRIGNDAPTNAAPCIFAHEVLRDGGYQKEADGGERFLQHVCALPNLWSFAAVATDGGWATLSAFGSDPPPFWTYFRPDGGLDQGFLDAGVDAGPGYVEYVADDVDGTLLLSASSGAWLRSWTVSPPSTELTVALDATGECYAWDPNPLSYACVKSGSVVWYGPDGGTLTPPFVGYPAEMRGKVDRLVVMLARDGGFNSRGYDFAAVVDGGFVAYASFDVPSAPAQYTIHELGGRLQLVTWGGPEVSPESMEICPNCRIEKFSGEFVCVP